MGAIEDVERNRLLREQIKKDLENSLQISQRALSHAILKELMIMNKHLAIITGDEIDEHDLDKEISL